ncbi:hypothetical protein Bca4012_066691 [Brassica carinata]|uniref:Uncharacterized protein n=1 Tax=Brassica carinata TaxID=52824 RepID=A0A8X7VQZ8_BRACI|nr:hypothetical protein Bca52824_018968 [Brassica carinata]
MESDADDSLWLKRADERLSQAKIPQETINVEAKKKLYSKLGKLHYDSVSLKRGKLDDVFKWVNEVRMQYGPPESIVATKFFDVDCVALVDTFDQIIHPHDVAMYGDYVRLPHMIDLKFSFEVPDIMGFLTNMSDHDQDMHFDEVPVTNSPIAVKYRDTKDSRKTEPDATFLSKFAKVVSIDPHDARWWFKAFRQMVKIYCGQVWFRTGLELCNILFDNRQYTPISKILKELHKYCQKEDGTNDEDKTRELVWFMQLNFSCTLKQATTEITRYKNSTKRHFFIKPDAYEHIDHKVIGLLHERGGKMYMAECQWTEAYVPSARLLQTIARQQPEIKGKWSAKTTLRSCP